MKAVCCGQDESLTDQGATTDETDFSAWPFDPKQCLSRIIEARDIVWAGEII
jgi:hypothetical protein